MNTDLIFMSEDITILFFHVLKYRSCIIYIGIQESSHGERILAYIETPKSFAWYGASYESMTNKKIIDQFYDQMQKLGLSYERSYTDDILINYY